MHHGHWQEFHSPARPAHRERLPFVHNRVRRQDGRIPFPANETILKPAHQAAARVRIEIHRNGAALANGQSAHIVYAVRLIGMVMRVDHAIEMRHACVQQLLPQIR